MVNILQIYRHTKIYVYMDIVVMSVSLKLHYVIHTLHSIDKKLYTNFIHNNPNNDIAKLFQMSVPVSLTG